MSGVILQGGLSVGQVLGRVVDPRFDPTERLLAWLKECDIWHSGWLSSVPSAHPPSIVQATDRAFNVYREEDKDFRYPLARTEVPFESLDNQFDEASKQRFFGCLTDLGAFYSDYAPPPPSEGPLDNLLWHTGYLPELILQYQVLCQQWRSGVRWKELRFLGAETSVGADPSAHQLKTIFCEPNRYKLSLDAIYLPNSLHWYVPCTELVQAVWEDQELPMPEGMRDVPVTWIAAPDGTKPDGSRKLANTQDTLTKFLQTCGVDLQATYGLCTRAPAALRQWLITVQFLHEQIPGFLPKDLAMICAPAAEPWSRWICGREFANTLRELAKLQQLGIPLDWV